MFISLKHYMLSTVKQMHRIVPPSHWLLQNYIHVYQPKSIEFKETTKKKHIQKIRRLNTKSVSRLIAPKYSDALLLVALMIYIAYKFIINKTNSIVVLRLISDIHFGSAFWLVVRISIDIFCGKASTCIQKNHR